MRKFLLLLLLPLFLLTMVSCRTTTTTYGEGAGQDANLPAGDYSSLEKWIDNDLVPAIAEVLDENRDVRGLPFMIVGWDAEKQTLKPEIDQFSSEIREMLISSLLKQQNDDLRLVVRSRPMDQKHHTGRISCEDYRQVGLYVLLKVRQSKLTGRLVIEVNGAMLNDETFQFVPGLSQKFELEPNARMLALFNQTSPDEYLRGLRYLPFAAGQKDLLASYLARRLTCQFRENFGDSRYRVYMDAGKYRNNSFLNQIFNLTGRYLSMYNEIEMAGAREGANIILTCSSAAIEGDVQQVWISSEEIASHRVAMTVEGYIKKK